jgi:hypothetical protein
MTISIPIILIIIVIILFIISINSLRWKCIDGKCEMTFNKDGSHKSLEKCQKECK